MRTLQISLADLWNCWTHSLLVCLVNGIHGILDGNTFQVSSCYLHTQGEVQVDSLDGWLRQQGFQYAGVINSVGALVDLPICVALAHATCPSNRATGGQT